MTKNPLTNIIPMKYRKYLYALAFVAAFVYAVYEANGHDWKRTAGALVGAVLAALAHGNATPTQPAAPRDEAGSADVGLILLTLTLIGVVLLLFRVHFGG